MKFDQFLKVISIGLFSAIPHEVITLTIKKLHLLNISAFEAYSMMFMRQSDWFLGILALPSVSVVGAISFHYLLKVIGTESLSLKAIIFGMTVNALIFQVFGNLIGNQNMILSMAGNYFFAFSAAVTGFIAGILMRRYVYKY